jgi:hypothetical protein
LASAYYRAATAVKANSRRRLRGRGRRAAALARLDDILTGNRPAARILAPPRLRRAATAAASPLGSPAIAMPRAASDIATQSRRKISFGSPAARQPGGGRTPLAGLRRAQSSRAGELAFPPPARRPDLASARHTLDAMLARQYHEVAMTYRGHIRNGVAVLDEPAHLPDGTAVRVEVDQSESPDGNRVERLFTALDKARNPQSIASLSRADLYDRSVLR